MAVALTLGCGREGVRMARLAQASGGSRAVLLAGIVPACCAAAGFALWLGQSLAPLLAGGAARLFAALALALAAADLAVLRAGPPPREPTRSLGALALVLLAALVSGAAGFVLLALTLALPAPLLAAAGGGCGAIVALGVAALAGRDWEARLPLAALRIGAVLALAAAAGALALFG